jgi:DNA-binding NarL/FixJ family response regulator
MTTTVMVVDDHPVLRAGILAVLSTQSAVTVVDEAGSAEEALVRVRTSRPDVVLMDLRLGSGMDGVAATAALRALAEPPAVVILTTYDTDADILRAVAAGAAGFLLKDAPTREIVAAVTAAAAGRSALNERARAVVRLAASEPALSARELEVVGLLAEGLTNRSIAQRLHLSEATVKTHLIHVFDKLGADNRTAAVTEARIRGLVR